MDEQRMMTAPAFLQIMAPRHPRLGSNDDRLTGPHTREERPLDQRLRSVRNLISTLDEAGGTAPEELMQWTLSVLHSAVLRPTIRLSKGQLTTVMTTLSELNHEATRATPDTVLFCQRAQLVVDVLLSA